MSPVLWPAALRIESIRYAVVVFPFVPVTPIIKSPGGGIAESRCAHEGHRPANVRHEHLGDARPGGTLRHQCHGSRGNRLPGVVVTVVPGPGNAEEEVARARPCGSRTGPP